MLFVIGFYLIGITILFNLCYVLAHALFSPLRYIPGPFAARFTNLWYLWRLDKARFELENIELHRKYASKTSSGTGSKAPYFAPIVRLGPNLYSLATPDKAVYGIQSKMPKSNWYKGFAHPSPERWSLFTESDIKRHGDTRRMFQSMYSMSSLMSYESYVDECASIFETRLQEISQKNKTINMGHWLQCYAFDVIGDITYSKRFGFLDEGKDVGGTIQALDRMLRYGALVGVFSWMHPLIYAITERIPGSAAAKRNFLTNFVLETTAKRREERKERKDLEGGATTDEKEEEAEVKPMDFLDKLLDAEKDGKRGAIPYHSFMMGIANIVAGSDTTAVSLSSILYYLIRNPQAMQKLREETDRFTKEGRCEENRVGFKDSQDMRYLQACIKEGLRLHAATGLPLWRVVPEGGAEICGQYFPAGTEIGVNCWVSHYDEDIWGKDAREFRPERWIEAEDEGGERLKRLEAAYMPFGLGSRTCLGRHISYLEMTKLIPQIVRRFDFELEHANRDWNTRNYWFVKQTDFRVKVKVRQEKV